MTKKQLISAYGGSEKEWRIRKRDVILFLKDKKDRFNGSYGWYEMYSANLLKAWWQNREKQSLVDTDRLLWQEQGKGITEAVHSMWR